MTHAESFSQVLAYVEDELSFATSYYNDSYLDRRISSRIRRLDAGSYEEYLEILRTDPDERAALLDTLSINVTGFFRNPDVWIGIRNILRTLSETNTAVHVWSAACADGREAYSLSMLAHADPEIDASSVRVLGTDISEPALEIAHRGVYEELRTVDFQSQLGFLDDWSAYVTKRGRQYEVREHVRRNVTFKRHDLINDGPKPGFHLVICRNLFIYIDNGFKESVLETLDRSLRPGGYLVIGKAETISGQVGSDFDVRDSRLRIYEKFE